MEIAIIGAGNVGTALAIGLTQAGHNVTISAGQPEHAQEVARAAGARAATSNGDAVRNAELVILAVPFTAAPEVVGQLGDALGGKVVVDATNQLSSDYSQLDRWDLSAAERIQARSAAPVVKAFNTTFAVDMPTGRAGDAQLDGYFAGDDAQAKTLVAQLLGQLGFRPIDAGGLVMARVLEGMALLNIALQSRYGWPWQSGFRLVGPTSVTEATAAA